MRSVAAGADAAAAALAIAAHDGANGAAATLDRAPMGENEVADIAARYEGQPEKLLAWAAERFGRALGICSSFQAEGCVLIDMAWRIDPKVRVFTIDTGRMPNETYELIDQVRDRYGIEVEVFMPDAGVTERMTSHHGLNLFYRDLNSRLLCCQVRKVIPLRRALANYGAWVTGLRRGQWESRANLRVADIDRDHGGIVKLAPLAAWSEAQVWDYIHAKNVPYSSLYDKGYKSIGCAPCTRPVAEGEDPRAGRWWWESDGPKECGMHCTIETTGFEGRAGNGNAGGV
ncbi:MAG TPA: phosphoadenylyl-sulfate reductase [Candidatus Binataceae bacterium]|nr:phosphoadenylyl-sulfate reductase [Candidatus Binataceae bacterium]